MDVTAVLWLKNVPILYVNQSGNVYLVVNSENIVRVYSRFDETYLVCSSLLSLSLKHFK